MKVLMLLSNSFFPDPRVLKEASSLVKHGYHVTILCWDRTCSYPKKEMIEGICIERIHLKSKYGTYRWFIMFWFIIFFRALKKPYDALHTHDWDTAIVGYFLSFIKKRKWIYDSHDIFFYHFCNDNGRGIMARIIEFLDKRFSRRCSSMFVATEKIIKQTGSKEYYQSLAPKKRIIALWNSPRIADLKIPSRKRKKKNITIGYLGNVRYYQEFINLFEATTNEHIVITGMGKYVKPLRKASKRYDKSITFTGHVTYEKVFDYYKQIDILFGALRISGNKYRDFNLTHAIETKMLEAALQGIPTISSAHILGADFVRKYKCGILLKDYSVSSIRSALRKAKTCTFDYKSLQKTWSWEAQEVKLVRQYDHLLKNKKKR